MNSRVVFHLGAADATSLRDKILGLKWKAGVDPALNQIPAIAVLIRFRKRKPLVSCLTLRHLLSTKIDRNAQLASLEKHPAC